MELEISRYLDVMAELNALQETAGITDYHEKFELICGDIAFSEAYLVSVYLAGLQPDTQANVRMFRPKSIRHCLLIGRLYESAHPCKPKEAVEELLRFPESFAIAHTPDALKVGLASIPFYFQTAHQSLVQLELGRTVVLDWQSNKILLKEQFAEVLEDPIAELKALKDIEELAYYHDKFELICTRVSLSEPYLVSAYLDGLRPDAQMHLRMFQLQSVRECLLLGRLYEKAHPRKPSSSNWQSSRNTPLLNSQGLFPAIMASDRISTSESQLAPQKFLTSYQVNESRATGLCYFSNEKIMSEHHLKHKKTPLYMLYCEDVLESDDAEIRADFLDEAPQISVSVVAGTSVYSHMCVKEIGGMIEQTNQFNMSFSPVTPSYASKVFDRMPNRDFGLWSEELCPPAVHILLLQKSSNDSCTLWHNICRLVFEPGGVRALLVHSLPRNLRQVAVDMILVLFHTKLKSARSSNSCHIFFLKQFRSAMEDTQSVSVLLDSATTTIQQLQQAFAELESHRAVTLNLKWKELEAHFHGLQRRFDELEDQEKEYESKTVEAHEILEKRKAYVVAKEQECLEKLQEKRDSALFAISKAWEKHRKLLPVDFSVAGSDFNAG